MVRVSEEPEGLEENTGDMECLTDVEKKTWSESDVTDAHLISPREDSSQKIFCCVNS